MTQDTWQDLGGLDLIEDVVRLYPDGVTTPLFAGRIAWKDRGNASIMNYGDVHISSAGLTLSAVIWTGAWTSAGEPLMAWVDPPMEFANVDALQAWLAPVVESAVESEPLAEYIEPEPAVEPEPLAEYIEPEPMDVGSADAEFVEAPAVGDAPIAGAYFDPMPMDMYADEPEYVEPPPADTVMDVVAFVDPEAFDAGEGDSEYFPRIDEV